MSYQTGKDPEWNSKILELAFLGALLSKIMPYMLTLGVLLGFWPTPEGVSEVCVY